MTKVVIVDAVRTPIGAFGGALASLTASHMGSLVIKALLERNKLSPEAVDEVILGQVVTAGVGQNPARLARSEA